MTSETVVLAAAAVVGPVVAVLVALWVEGRRSMRQEAAYARMLEAFQDRAEKWEMARAEPTSAFNAAWFKEFQNVLLRLADALEKMAGQKKP